MLKTENLGLNLPENSDQYNIDDYNDNSVAIDNALYTESQDRAGDDAQIRKDISPITQEQIDALLNFPTDAVTELTGIRIGYDGTVYASAGEAVRAQINQVIVKINELKSTLDNLGLSVVNGELSVTYTKENN